MKKKLKWKFQNKINISHQNVEFAMILHIELNSKWKLSSFKITKKINSNHQIQQYFSGLWGGNQTYTEAYYIEHWKD
jgi:hypothetical protein